MRAYVGVTDERWSRFLAARPHLSEVNFWRPGGTGQFHRIGTGEPFLFKSHYPENAIIGGGFFSGFARLRIDEAWDFFGEANGAATHDEMREQISRYRREPTTHESRIGCVMLRDVRFFAPGQRLPAPRDMARNIVQGKGYNEIELLDPEHEVARAFFQLVGPGVYQSALADETLRVPGSVFGAPTLTRPRAGQQAFKAMVLDAYNRHCAITGSKIQPVLQAAHIRPVGGELGGENRLDNGVLLRSDVHTLFDDGYLTIDTGYRLRVSPRLRTEFGNGEEFYARQGATISVPDRRPDRPAREFLEWHNDVVFQAR